MGDRQCQTPVANSNRNSNFDQRDLESSLWNQPEFNLDNKMDKHELEVLRYENGYFQVKGEGFKILFIMKSIRYMTKKEFALDLQGKLGVFG